MNRRYSLPIGSKRQVLPKRLRRRIERSVGTAPAPDLAGWLPDPGPVTWESLLCGPRFDCFRWAVRADVGGFAFRCGWCATCVAKKAKELVGRAWAVLLEHDGVARVDRDVADPNDLREAGRPLLAFRDAATGRYTVFVPGTGGYRGNALEDALLDAVLALDGKPTYGTTEPDPDREPDPRRIVVKASREQLERTAKHFGYGLRWLSRFRFRFTRDGADTAMADRDFVGFASALSPGYRSRAAPLAA